MTNARVRARARNKQGAHWINGAFGLWETASFVSLFMPHSDTPARARARGDKAAGLLRCVRLSTRVVKGFPGSVLDVGRRVIRIGEARVVRGYLLMFSSVSVFWRDGTTALRTARVRTICAPVALAMAVKAALVLDRNAAAAPPGRLTVCAVELPGMSGIYAAVSMLKPGVEVTVLPTGLRGLDCRWVLASTRAWSWS